MKEKIQQYLSPGRIATLWDCHRSTVARIMARHGFGAFKMGAGTCAIIRYREADVLAVEELSLIRHGSPTSSSKRNRDK